MFTAEQRTFVRSKILERAACDPHISSAAITGSGSVDGEDEWSDIDLAFALAEGVELMAALSDWTAYMYDQHSAIHHLDVPSGAWLYRVFLLPGTLQVDLAFVSVTEFRPLGSTFKLVFGTAHELQQFPSLRPQASSAWDGYMPFTPEAASRELACGKPNTWLVACAIRRWRWPVFATMFLRCTAAGSITCQPRSSKNLTLGWYNVLTRRS
jgi:hypothetical protein